MGRESASPCSQKPKTGPYPRPSTAFLHILLRAILVCSCHLCLGLPTGHLSPTFCCLLGAARMEPRKQAWKINCFCQMCRHRMHTRYLSPLKVIVPDHLFQPRSHATCYNDTMPRPLIQSDGRHCFLGLRNWDGPARRNLQKSIQELSRPLWDITTLSWVRVSRDGELWRLLYFGTLCPAVWQNFTHSSEKCTVPIFRLWKMCYISN
jgi:hypothetical protein